MGTSSKWKGPSDRQWTLPKKRLKLLLVGPADNDAEVTDANNWDVRSNPDILSEQATEKLAHDLIECLAVDIRDDPRAHGLQTAWQEASEPLMRATGFGGRIDWIDNLGELPEHQRTDEFVRRFVDRISPEAGSMIDAVVRHAAGSTAEEALRQSPELHAAVSSGQGIGLSEELLCWLYKHFFAHTVSFLLEAVITAHLDHVAPPISIIDTESVIARTIARQIMRLLPSPCEVTHRHPTLSLMQAGRQLASRLATIAFERSEEGTDPWEAEVPFAIDTDSMETQKSEIGLDGSS